MSPSRMGESRRPGAVEQRPDLSGTAGSPTSVPARGSGAGLLRSAILPVVVFVLVIVVGLLGNFGLRSLWPQPQPAPTPPPASESDLSRPAPPGWQQDFAWAQEISPTGDLAVVRNRVAMINANGALVVMNADTGSLVWASEPNAISPTARPLLALADDQLVAGIYDEQPGTLYLAPLDTVPSGQTGQLVDRALPRGARVIVTGDSLMISTSERVWVIDSDLNLDEVPTGSDEPMAVQDGQVVAGPWEGPWSLNAPNNRRQVQAERPEGVVGEPHPAYSSRGVIVVWWETEDDDRWRVSFHNVASGELLADAEVGADDLEAVTYLSVTGDGALASAGPVLADLRSGQTEVEPGWSSISAVSASAMYGATGQGNAVWTGEEVELLPPGTALPWGTSLNGLAIVLDRTADGATLVGGLRQL